MIDSKDSVQTIDDKIRLLRLFIYYDVFDHFMSKEELLRDSALKNGGEDLIQEFLEKEWIYQNNNYFGLRNNGQLAKKRSKGQQLADKTMPRARKMARLIAQFPFVRAVALSGSISKGYMDSLKDVDYFIITKPSRLWLARTMLVMFKKIFLLNSFRFFCLNYFVDEENLQIGDENLFTATELNTLVPIYGMELNKKFFDANAWVRQYYPNYPQNETSVESKPWNCFLKRTMEFLLSNSIGEWLDKSSMKLTIKYWKKKYKGEQNHLFHTSFRFRRDEAKYHPGNFQEKVLKKFEENLSKYEKKWNIKLNHEN